jgi:hypothetical protein
MNKSNNFSFTQSHHLNLIVLNCSSFSSSKQCRRKPIVIRKFKLHVSGNSKRQVRNFLAKFSLNVFVSYLLSCVERIIMDCSFKTASSFTFYCLIPNFFLCLAFAVCRITRSLNSLITCQLKYQEPPT